MKSERCVQIHTILFNRASTKKIGHVNEAIQYDELEINNKMTTCADKDKQTLSVYNIKGEEKTFITSEKK